jgi:ligand-binding SRPBCC domain-containing protein
MPRLVYQQTLPIGLAEAWNFFSNPVNLAKITPSHLDFRILFNDAAENVYPGCIIKYKISPVAGIPITWITEITHVEPLRYFIDVQLSGPYKIWHHQHHFKETRNGTEMTDLVTYKAGYGILGTLAQQLFVNRMVSNIFRHREKTLAKIL